MDFFAIVLFLFIYYIRPQEWIPVFASLKPVKMVMVMALAGTFMKNKGLGPKDFFKTPQDYIMALYFLWVIWSASSAMGAFTEFLKYMVFYYVTIQVLSSMRRIQVFINWWTVMILAIAALAVASLYIWDPMGSKDLTENHYKGRLVLSTSIFNNPNALGHGVVPVVPMLYYLFFWKRPFFMKELALVIVCLPLYCLYLTLSKGAYISGGVTLLLGLMFGRPKIMQVIILVGGVTLGVSAMQALPRMNELSADEGGIAGRLIAWDFGYRKMTEEPNGLGWKRFIPTINQELGIRKAAHSSYVQTGAELGYNGLFLFCGILYGCMRTLMTVRTNSLEEERLRRLLFCLVVSYALSSWVIDFGARSTLFFIPAAVAAFHRQVMVEDKRLRDEAQEELDALEAAERAGTHLPENATPYIRQRTLTKHKTTRKEKKAILDRAPSIKWDKLGPLDFVMMYVCTSFAVKFWETILDKFFTL